MGLIIGQLHSIDCIIIFTKSVSILSMIYNRTNPKYYLDTFRLIFVFATHFSTLAMCQTSYFHPFIFHNNTM